MLPRKLIQSFLDTQKSQNSAKNEDSNVVKIINKKSTTREKVPVLNLNKLSMKTPGTDKLSVSVRSVKSRDTSREYTPRTGNKLANQRVVKATLRDSSALSHRENIPANDDKFQILTSRSDKNSIILPTNKRKINKDLLTDAKFIESTSS